MLEVYSTKKKPVFEIFIVMATIVSIKNIMDYFGIIGAGSIGIWAGIILSSLYMRKNDKKWKDYGLGFPNGAKNWLKSILLAIATVIAVFLIMGLVLDPILSSIGLVKPETAADRFMFFLGKPFVFLAYLIFIIWFGAALGEELLMRGYLLNRLTDIFGTTKSGWCTSIVLHGVIFGSLHIYQGLAGVIITSVIGMILGTVYLTSKKKLFPVVLAHILINSISITAFYLNDGVIN